MGTIGVIYEVGVGVKRNDMNTYSEIIDTKDISRLSQIDRNDLRFLWYANWWDGPISGMLIYQNKKCWFELISENENAFPDEYYRRYLIIELSVSQIEEEEYWHALFVKQVGEHMDIDENGVRHRDRVKPFQSHQVSYEAYKTRTPMDLSENFVLGFFEL